MAVYQASAREESEDVLGVIGRQLIAHIVLTAQLDGRPQTRVRDGMVRKSPCQRPPDMAARLVERIAS